MKARRLLTLLSLSIFSFAVLTAQPTWVPGTPSTGTTGPTTIPVNYGINITGTVYIAVLPYTTTANFSGASIKGRALVGPGGGFVAVAVLPVNAGNVGAILQTIIDVTQANTSFTIYLSAESSTGVIQTTATRIYATTLPCPDIYFLNALQQIVKCVNKGATAIFNMFVDPDPLVSGILKGTTWVIDWGDGNIVNYTSTADGDYPPLAMRTHTYSNVTSCNYVFTCGVRNPCGKTFSPQYVAIVHGRDISTDGDGNISIVNNAGGSSTINVCEGAQTIITLRDNSTWNCQHPTVSGGLTAVPNNSTRNIEWRYGLDPTGATFNTITGTVNIASMGSAPAASGRMLPSPYGTGSLSQAITIPATCKAGEYFRVYLEYWNQECNWNDNEYVANYVDINVVAAPPAPTAPGRTICFGDNRTLTVTSAPVGTLNWYSDAALTNFLWTGATYTPTQSAVGTYTFYVADRSATGLMCQGPATMVTLTINPIPQKPTISHPLKNDICYDGGITTYTMTAVPVTPPAVSSYQWYKDGVAIAGETNASIVISQPSQTGSYTVSTIGVAPSNCVSPPSDPWYVTVHTLSNLTNPVPVTICQNQSAVFSAFTTDQVQNWQWEVSTNGGASFTTVGNGPPYSGFNTNTLTITTPLPSFNGYLYRVEIKTPPGQGGCAFKSAAAMLTVDALPTASAGNAIRICSSSPTDPITMTGAVAGGTYTSAVWTGGAGLGTWTQNSNPALAYFTPSVSTGTFTARLSVTGTAACSGVVATSTRTVSWSQTPTAEAGPDISRCDATPLAFIAMTGASAGGNFSSANWSGGSGLGTWSQNANPALARFTPSTSSGSFTATLTVTGRDGCTGTNPTDTRTITWGQTPVAEAGNDISRCDGTPQAVISMAGASATGTYTNAIWSGGGGSGSWSQNANPALATFTPSVNVGSFTATLSLTGTGACTGTNSSDTRTISWGYAATVNAGPDQSVCATATVPLAGSIGGGASSAIWTGGTGTYNPNNTALNAVYTPSLAERTAQTVTLTLTTNDPAGVCPAVSDNITIAIGTLPTSATLTSSGDACSGAGASWINSVITGGAPPYTISYRRNGFVMPNITNYSSGTNYSLGSLAVGSYTYEITQIRDNCGNTLTGAGLPAPVTITIYQTPVANAGSDQAVCGILSASLSAIPSVGTGTWTKISGPGTVTFSPDANNPNATIAVSDYGSYVIRWTEVNNICSSSSDKTVMFERTANAGPDQNLCGTLSAVMAGNTPAVGTGTWTKVSGPGTVSFTPNANTPGASANVSLPGTYVFRWTIAIGAFCSTTSTVTVTYERAANAGSNQNLCNTFVATLAGNAPAVGTGSWSLVSGPGTVSFTPNANTPGATATVTAYGAYTYRWTIANGVYCSTNQTVSVTYNPLGQVNQPANQVVCNANATAAVNFTTSNAGGITTYSWTNNNTSIGLAGSGTGNIASFTAANTGTAPVTATITVTPTYSDGVVNCTGSSKTFTITVNPTGQVNQPANQVLCNGNNTAAVTFSTNSTGGTTTYSWTNSDSSIGLAGSGSGNIAAFAATNTGTAPVVATITVTPTYTNGSVSCAGPAKSFTITVNPTGQINQPSDQVVCNGGSTSIITFGTANTGGSTTYSWTNNNTSIGLAANGTGGTIAAFTATNSGTSPVTATITVTPTFANASVSCSGPSKSFTITVNPTAQVNQPANQIVCNGSNTTAITFGTTNTGGTTTYSWTNNTPSIGLGANGTGNIAVFSAANNGTTPVTATIVVTPSFTNGSVSCTGPTKSFTITVNPTPKLSGTLTPAAICSNTVFSYTPTSATTGTTFTWNRASVAGISPAGPTSGTGNPNETLVNLTSAAINVTYAYTLQANGCSNTQNVVVSVKPEPVISNQSVTVCSDVALNYSILLDNFTNPGAGVTFTWPAPILSAGISGGTARGSASSANITDTFLNTTGLIGTATYHVTPYYNGCTGSPKDIVVNVGSQPVLDPGLNNTICSNTATGLILKEAAGSVVPTHYNIISITTDAGLTAAGSNAVIPNSNAPANYLAGDIFANLTGVNKNVTYQVQPVLAPDCYGDPVNIVITIRPQPVIIPGQTKTVCSRTPIGKEILLIPANTPAGTIFNWGVPVMSDASGQGTAGVNVAADPAGTIHINDIIHNYSSAPITALYTITPVSQAGCAGDAIPIVITINQEPVPQPISGRINLCAGEKNVVYNVSPTGGSSFHWTVDPAVGTKTFDFNTNAILIDAAASTGSGNITVFETNSLGCSGDPSSLTVNVYSQPVPENITGDVVVCALSTHTYSVTNRPGSVYSWTVPGGAAIIGDPSASTVSVLFGSTGGTILVRETNIAGCVTNHNPMAVTVDPLPTAVISNGGTICDGGTRPLNVAFIGTAPFNFTYAINGVPQAPVSTSSNPYIINATLQGTYTIVNVTDNTGCTNTGSGTAVVSYYNKPSGTISGTTEICRGNTATVTMTFTGTPPFTFTYTDGTTPVTVNASPSNVYTINVSPVTTTTYTLTSLTDGNSCTGVLSGSAVITVNQPPVLSLTGTNLTCYNISTGAIDLTISNGTSPFGITWSGPDGYTANVEDISGLKAGYYSVSVTDTKGCSATGNITLTQPPVLNASVSGTNITCFGANDGTITISGATGGAGTYEYSINGGTSWASSGSFTGLAPGTYNVQIRDAVNTTCVIILNSSLVLTGPAALNATVTKTDVTCFGANNGSIIISSPAGGYGTYQYTIDGGTTWLGSGNFTNLSPGTYNVRIRDAANTGCFVILNPAVVVTEPPVLSATVNSTNISCFGSTDGSITITSPSGGHGTYQYSINGGGSWQSSGSYTGLTPGSYNVQIRDAAYTNCYIILNSALVLTQPTVLSATVSSTDVTCNGANDGTISVTAPSGGYGTYEYSINGGSTWFPSGLFTGLAPGTYDVRIRDAANTNCTLILNGGLQINGPAALTATVVSTNITCFSAGDGAISVTNASGGYGTYQFSIDGGTTWQNSSSFSMLSAGSYNVMMRDRTHTSCTVTINPAVVIPEPAVLNATVSSVNITCNGANDGIINITSPSGGYGSYSYSINGGATWQGSGTFTNLAPGTYNVRIRDALYTSCTIILNPAVVITEPVILSANVTSTNISCNGASDGTITISAAAGGYGSYEYSVNGGGTWQASGNFTGLAPGFYNVRMRDAAHTNCVITLNGGLRLTEPSILSASVASTNVTCNGAGDGTITISAPSGGYGTYEYSIDAGASWHAAGSFTGLAPASYNVQIRDAAHITCVIILNPALVITQPAALSATVTGTNVTCFGASNGIITITNPAGGYGSYEYTINGGSTWVGTGTFSGLAPGTYDVRIRDAAHIACSTILNAALVITQPAVLHADITGTNVTCFGGNDGSVTLSNPTGGYGTYEYTINGGGSWQASGAFSGLGPGAYNVQIRDAANTSCIIVLNNAFVISQPAVLKANIASTNVTCNGAGDGTITISGATGGSGAYQYSVSGGSSWQASGTFSGLAPSSYDVRIRDAAHPACEIILNPVLTINEPAVMNAAVSSTNVTCNGANDGTVTISSPSGGYGTYEYTVNGGTSWQPSGNFTGLAPASYNVQIRDAAHTSCVIILNPALAITQPAVLSATVTATMPTCNGANDGIITITNPAGGYGTYAYSINGGGSWQTSGTFTGVAPGSYDVRIRDAAHLSCEIILNAALSITQPAKLSATVASTNVTCNGAGDGTITITAPSGGYGTYEYSIDAGASWHASGSFTGLGPGFYYVQIRDAAHNGCTVSLNASLRITEPSILSASVASTNVTCNGAGDGTITISAPSGGYGTYEYSIDAGASWHASGSFTGLAPASYNVQIRDAAHITCVIILNPALVITQPAALSATVTGTNVTCFGAANGIITITNPAGGYGSYEYTINGGSTWVGTGTFSGLAPGTYDVRIRDAAHIACSTILNAALVITQPAVLHADITGTNVTCFGGNDGSVTLSNPTGGYGTYEYTINGGGSWQASGAFSGLGPGAYNVQIRDAANTSCIIVLNNAFVISQPAVLKANIASTNVTCNGAGDGTITISGATGGSGAYQYSVSGGSSWQASGTFSGLAPSSYDVRIRDAAHPACEIILNPALTINEPAVMNAAVSSTNVTCNGANDGTVTISSPSGGYGTYEYTVNGGTSWQVGGSFSSLAPGSYDVRIRDRAHTGCVIILNAALVITEPAVLNATVSGTDVTCNGAGDGTISITAPSGGYGIYEYTINGGSAWQSSGLFTGIAPGTYNVRIRDAAHTACEIILNPALTITQPVRLSATIASTNVTCNSANDGTITITSPAGGYGTYEYSIDGGTSWQPSGSFTGLVPGFYNIQIRDAAHTGCVVTLNGGLRITEPSAMTANVTATNVTCFGASDGRISITSPSGGYGTYEYSVNGGTSWQPSGSFTSLTPASYNVQIRDAAHISCVVVLNAALVITEPPVLSASATGTDLTCNGVNDGIITITGATGGYGTYQYTINGGTTWFSSGLFTNLAPGSYNVQIRDAANPACIIIINSSLVINEPAALNATVTATNISCFGNNNGTITISAPTGGYGSYEYTINGGGSWQSSGSFTGLGPGNYNVQMRDASHTGCVKVINSSLSVTQPAMLNAVVTPTMVTCNGNNDGIISITSPTGGYGTYEYSVNGGSDWSGSGLFNGLAPGNYNVQIRDASNTGCIIVLNNNLLITEPSQLNAVVSSTDITCNGANDGTINITFPTGGYGTYEYSINGGTSWQVTGNYPGLAPGTYIVAIRDRAHTGCVRILNPGLTLNQPQLLSATVTSTNVTCSGSNDGSITVSSPAGGYGIYSYSVNGGSSWQSSGSFTNLSPGNYDVRIRDAQHPGCVIILNPALTVTEPAVLNASVSSTDVSCYGASDGTITVTSASGGYGTYEYTVNGGALWQSSGTFTALAPGFYNVQIRDAAHTGCVRTLNGSLRISEPPVLSAIVSRTNTTCSGNNDGTITITGATGGYGTYEYSTDGGTSWQPSGNFSSLAPGTYNVQIRDAAHTGCVVILNPSVSITSPSVLNATVTPTMVSCSGAGDGIITFSGPSGGSGFYMYSVNGGTAWQGTGTFYNLAPGNYDVRIRDALNINCVVILNPALSITQPAALGANISGTNVTCFGGNDGTITISGASGGYGTYEYSITGGGYWQASGTFTGLTPGTYNILIRDAGHTGCIVVLNSSYIISQPAMLSASISKTDVSCNGNNDGSVSVTSPSGGNGTYEYSDNGGASWQSSGIFSNLAPGTYNIQIRDAAHQACSVILYPNLVISEPLPLTLSSTGDVVLDCNGDMDGTGTFYASGGTMPYSFIIVSNNTGGTIAAPGFNSQSFYNAGAGSVTVRVVDINGCSAQATVNLTQPAALTPGSISADQILCFGGNPATLTESSAAGGGPGSYIYQWQSAANIAGPFINIAGATSNQYTPPAGATYTLYYRRMVSSGVCLPVYSNVIEVRVNPLPIAILTGGETICPGQSSILKVNLPAGTGPFTIDIDNLGTVTGYTSGSDISVSPAVTTTYRITRVRDANNCEVLSPSVNINGSATVIVNTLPSITSFTPSSPVCEFTLANFRVTASGTNLTYQWYVNEGTGFAPVTDGGTYYGALSPNLQIFNSVRTMNGYIYHVVVSGCGNNVTSADAVFTVNTAPEITRHPKDTTICLGQNAVLEADATGTSLTWQWYVNKGSGFVPVADDANFSGSATRTLTVTNGSSAFNNWVFRATASGVCGVPVSTSFAVLRVINPPVVTRQPSSVTACENTTVSLFGNGTGYNSLQWQVFSGGTWTNISDGIDYAGSTSQMLTILSTTPAMNGYQYRLGLTGSCTTVYSNAATLTVNSNPVVNFSAISPINACGGVPVTINGNPTGGSGTYLQHRWTGDVAPLNSYTVQSPVFSSYIAGNYNLNYRVVDSNGCTANNDLTITVDSPDAQFTQDADYGCTPLTVTFTKNMTGLAKWWWNFGDGSPVDSVNANPVHTFANSLSGSIEYYTVSLIVQSPTGCRANYSSTITVYPAIDASFTPSSLIICSGNSITFTALSGAGRYFWDYGDGVNGYGSYISSHLYTNFTSAPVVHTVQLTTTSFYNCTDVKTVDITVMPVPQPQFTALPVSQNFNPAGNQVTFTNSTNSGTWMWFWKFGDNSTSTDMNPVHTFNNVGTYHVTLIASNAICSDSVAHEVYVIPLAPVAGFDSIPSGCAPLYVSINNTSLNTDTPGTTYSWNFGDGSTSTAKNPTYTYYTAGTYRIELTVTGPGGTSVMSRVVTAYPSPKAYFEAAPAEVYANDENVRCFNLSQGADYYIWDFGDGDTSRVAEPYHKYLQEGVYDITLWAYSNNGCSDKYALSPAVTVKPVGDLRYPTVFRPNLTGPIERSDLPTGGTEIDQFFYPPIRQTVTKYKLQIFNRWGVLIFESHNINVPWNGYYKGELCQQGVYVWYVEGKYQDGKPFKMVGNVTLLH